MTAIPAVLVAFELAGIDPTTCRNCGHTALDEAVGVVYLRDRRHGLRFNDSGVCCVGTRPRIDFESALGEP